jgi:hypothetical protein
MACDQASAGLALAALDRHRVDPLPWPDGPADEASWGLLRYIDSADVRQMITAATTKNEEFNNFTQWAFFGGQGIIAENLRHEQEKIIGYNHLVANMVILHNVGHRSRAINQLQMEGHTFTPEVLAGLSPYRTAHINRFGDYTVDLTRPVLPHDAGRRLLATETIGDVAETRSNA